VVADAPLAAAAQGLQVVLGPARSGKSRWAEQLAAASCRDVVYIATGPELPHDQAWQQRLRLHRQRRPRHWSLLEVPEPEQLCGALARLGPGQLALIDSLGSWVAAALDLDDARWRCLCERLLHTLAALPVDLVVVSEQTGWGVVPPTASGGLFRDRLGTIERQLVARAHTAWLVVAGYAIDIAAIGHPVGQE